MTTGDDDARSLDAAERAFAADAAAKGVAPAFLAVLDPDGVVFRPEPVNGRERFESFATDGDAVLEWEPALAETSADGTLGFTTGPFRFAPSRSEDGPSTHGHYLSVWIRPDGTAWRLAADIGIAHEPGLVVSGSVGPTAASGDPRATFAELAAFDRLATARGCSTVAAPDLAVYREGTAPAETAVAGCALLEATTPGAVAEPAGGALAASGDLGYSYGALRTAASARMAYVRVWRRDGATWRLRADVALAWPEEAPPAAP